MNINLLSSVIVTLFLTFGGMWLLPNHAYSQFGNLTGKCDPAYPAVCIKSPPPNLNCPDIPITDFKVLPPDPHGFDRDGNGIGCETVTEP